MTEQGELEIVHQTGYLNAPCFIAELVKQQAALEPVHGIRLVEHAYIKAVYAVIHSAYQDKTQSRHGVIMGEKLRVIGKANL